MFTIHHGDCLAVLSVMPDNSVDSIVTDPPYGLSFMGKKWDYDVPSVEIWAECLRVLKPGGHLLAFAGTRTQHRMAVNIEDAGFEIRDMISWVYGSGFPKSLDVSKAIDKAAGAEREVVGPGRRHNSKRCAVAHGDSERLAGGVPDITAPATDSARQWDGWGTALKPALEPITMARKPLDGTVAANVLAHGTAALNINGCRISFADAQDEKESKQKNQHGDFGSGHRTNNVFGKDTKDRENYAPAGRWPANLIHDGSDEVRALFPESSVTGSAARFFYCPKASKKDRDEGLEQMEQATASEMVNRADGSAGMNSPRAGAGRTAGARNHHPTVKPTELMRYLCRLITPPSGVVLDPFMGSGSTGKAALREGFTFIGIEREADYLPLARARLAAEVLDLSCTGTD